MSENEYEKMLFFDNLCVCEIVSKLKSVLSSNCMKERSKEWQFIFGFVQEHIDWLNERGLIGEADSDNVPELYATESAPFEKKIVYQRYEIKQLGFYWLIAELDTKNNTAFGYANLNNDELAEWGYISIKELLDNGAVLDKEWKSCSFKEAMQRIAEERRTQGGD